MRHFTSSKAILFSAVLLASVCGPACSGEAEAPIEPKVVFDSASAVWNMGGEALSADKPPLAVHGNVQLGVELSGLERNASLSRGGDGKAAIFDGGYLSFDAPQSNALLLAGDTMTLCLRMRDASGKWDAPLFNAYGPEGKQSLSLAGTNGKEKPMHLRNFFNQNVPSIYYYLFEEPNGFHRVSSSSQMIEFTLGVEPNEDFISFYDKEMKICDECIGDEVHKGEMTVIAPAGLIGSTDWHDIIVRFNGGKVQLFIDGVMVDEDFPVGTLQESVESLFIGAGKKEGNVVSGFQGMMDHAALWTRALSDAEITALSGGQDYAASRQLDIFGPPQQSLQYGRPAGLNIRAGDCIPYYDSNTGVFHLFYLIVRRNHHSKWQCGHGGLQVAHATTKDLVHWKQEELALPITEQWEGFIGTGSCIFNKGLYYWFYPVMSVVQSDAPGGVYAATSPDCIHFEKQLDAPALASGSDNDVFFDKESNRFCMLSAGPREADGRFRLDCYYSDDLANWTREEEPILRDETAFGCPNYFEWNGWHYIVGQSPRKIWRSRQLHGSYTLQMPGELALVKVSKVAAFGENRRISAGFLAEDGWGGDIVMWELTQREDGSVGVTFAPELIPPSGAPLDMAFEALTPGVSGGPGSIRITSTDKPEFAMLAGAPLNARVTLRVNPKNASGRFGVCLRGSGLYESGVELRFDPKAGCVQYGNPEKGKLAEQPISGWFEPYLINDVTGIDRPFDLDIIIKDGIIDANIDHQRTVITRSTLRGERLFFFADNADVEFEAITVRPLLEREMK